MTAEKIAEITHTLFPGYIGIILAGSQAQRKDFYAGSDIDLLILHPDYGALYNRKLKHGQYQFDYTVAPLFDLENTIFAQTNDLNGTLLSMIATGKILADTASILTGLQQKVIGIYNQLSSNTKKEYDRLLRELERMKKLYLKEMKEHERLLVLCEFVSTVVAVETIHLSKWRPTIKHRARLLYDKNRALTDELVGVIRASLQGDIVTGLDRFWTSYQEHRDGGIDVPVRPSGLVIAELAFPDFTLHRFVERVLPVILNDPSLAAGYRYYYSSPGGYWPAYRHQVCVLFDGGDPETALGMTTTLLRLLDKTDWPPQEMNTLYPKQRAVSVPFQQALERINSQLCQRNTALLREGDRWESRWLDAIGICTWLCRKLGLSDEDFIRCNLYLLQRWLIKQRELKHLSTYEELLAYRVDKYKMLNNAYKKKKAIIAAAMKDPCLPPELASGWEDIPSDREEFSATLPFLKPILELIDMQQIPAAIIYINIAEETLQLLNLSGEQKKQCCYFMTQR